MAKGICEFCGLRWSDDMRFGVKLCNECIRLYSSPDIIEDISSLPIERATPAALQLFDKKLKINEVKKEMERRRAIELEEQRLRSIQRQEEEIKAINARIEMQRLEQEKMDAFLKENGHEGYYEFKVLSILDERSGSVNVNELMDRLNYFGRQGWRLRCAFTNELGKNSASVGMGGFSIGTNSTADQSVLILERFIKFK